MQRLFTIGMLVLLAMASVGCNLSAGAATTADTLIEPLTPAAATIEPTTAPSSAAWPADWQLYVDDIAGIGFAFPQDWTLSPVSDETRRQGTGYTYTLASFDQATAPGRDGIPAGSTKLDISIGALNVMFGDDFTLEQAANYATTSDGVQDVLEQTAFALADGTPAIKIRLIGQFGDEFTSYILKIGDTGVSVGGLGEDMATVEQIVMSLHAA